MSNPSTADPTPARSMALAGAAALPPALLGDSASVRHARAVLERPGNAAILILADEGLGAAAAARHAHDCSRATEAFVQIDCARSDTDALGAALFGVRARASSELETLGPESALLTAGRGTVFLERLGELPSALQRRLARVLRDGEARTSGRERVPIKARVIAAAAPSLTAEARDGRFRPDLLRRFGSASVTIPSLGERPGDLSAIVARVASDLADASGRQSPAFTPAALTMLAAMPWPGNLDELQRVLARALARSDGRLVRQEDLLPAVPFDGIVKRMALVSLREARRRFEREYIASVLEQHSWRISEAARTLDIERANLYRKIRELGLQRAPGGRRHS